MDDVQKKKVQIASAWKFLPLWLFLIFFKFGGGLHYSLLSPLGVRILPIWIVGLLIGFASFVQFVLDVPAGKLLDRVGYRKLMLVGTCIFLIATLCLMFHFTLLAYVLSITFGIFGWLFFQPGANAYILSSAPLDRSGVFMSLRDISGSIGIVLSSALLPFAILLPTREMGLLLFVLLSVALISIAITPREKRILPSVETHSVRHHKVRREITTLIRTIKKLNPASTTLLLLHLASGIFYSMIWFVVPIVIEQQKNSALLGIGLGVFDFSVVVLGFALGTLADRANKRRLVFFGLLIFAIFGMLLGLNFGIFFILFGFLATSGEEMAGLSLWSWLHALDTDHTNDGSVSGVISLFEDFGWMIGPMLAGVLFTLIGPSLTIVIGATPILIIWGIYHLTSSEQASHYPLVPAARRITRRRHKS